MKIKVVNHNTKLAMENMHHLKANKCSVFMCIFSTLACKEKNAKNVSNVTFIVAAATLSNAT